MGMLGRNLARSGTELSPTVDSDIMQPSSNLLSSLLMLQRNFTTTKSVTSLRKLGLKLASLVKTRSKVASHHILWDGTAYTFFSPLLYINSSEILVLKISH